MPLSEDEQRILREIEANLSVTDPKLVQQVSDTTLYRHATRMIKWAAFGFVAGLVLLLTTFTSMLLAGVAGFLIMLFCLLVIERNVRKIGRAGLESLTGSLRGGALKGVFGNAGRRWRERWQRDDDTP
jgi:ABC-type multidrug transport system fused ATPase/permease subunit